MAAYKRKEVLRNLYDKALTICDKVFTSSRPTATEQMKKFIVVRLPQGIDPYADTHHISYAQMICFVRDKQGGLEDVNVMEDMVESVMGLFPMDDSLISCNNAPLLLSTKSDGMGFHSTIIQFNIVIKL